MAKFECKLQGDLNEIIEHVDNEILSGSCSASLEDDSMFSKDGCNCAVRVYERYSYFGQNRVSLSLTFFQTDNDIIFMSAITSGGSQAVFMKINTVGEETFLECAQSAVEKYRI